MNPEKQQREAAVGYALRCGDGAQWPYFSSPTRAEAEQHAIDADREMPFCAPHSIVEIAPLVPVVEGL